MSNYEERLDTLDKAAAALARAITQFVDEMTVEEAAKAEIGPVQAVVHGMDYFAGVLRRGAVHRMDRTHDITYHFGPRLYVVRRLKTHESSPLTWEELASVSTSGPFFHDFGASLAVARKDRVRRNTQENAEHPIRGHIPSKYLWQIWSYNPRANSWTRVEDKDE